MPAGHTPVAIKFAPLFPRQAGPIGTFEDTLRGVMDRRQPGGSAGGAGGGATSRSRSPTTGIRWVQARRCLPADSIASSSRSHVAPAFGRYSGARSSAASRRPPAGVLASGSRARFSRASAKTCITAFFMGAWAAFSGPLRSTKAATAHPGCRRPAAKRRRCSSRLRKTRSASRRSRRSFCRPWGPS